MRPALRMAGICLAAAACALALGCFQPPVDLIESSLLPTVPREMVVSRDGKTLVMAASEFGVFIVNTVDGRMKQVRLGVPVDRVFLSLDGSRVLAVSKMAARMVGVTLAGKTVSDLAIEGFDARGFNWLGSIDISPDQSMFVVAGSRDLHIKLMAMDGRVLKEFSPAPRKINAVAFAPDGTHVISVHQTRLLRQYPIKPAPASSDIVVWHTNGQPLRSFGRHKPFGGPSDLMAVAANPRAPMVAVADRNGGLSVWGLTGERVSVLMGPPLFSIGNSVQARVTSMRWSPNGALFAAGRTDGRIYIYKTNGRSLEYKASFAAHDAGTHISLAFAPNSLMLISAGYASGSPSLKRWSLELISR